MGDAEKRCFRQFIDIDGYDAKFDKNNTPSAVHATIDRNFKRKRCAHKWTKKGMALIFTSLSFSHNSI